ncbi:Ger(x)C family spore germination protein [Clostridium ganghwense]|uniref:Ger(X)C family spore germination protein n=1 Tax=Clostridium ganghwense TaxID=312089 RepID=A0ABT4CJK7_9CLOT|nr:Ger(x)C family spore germination protein [Clostridium ganghwense]MCY6369232.1 Ger(x)C family spore germination protein [Clostridium ganghwense]
MIKKRNKLCIIWTIILPILLTGCWDYADIDKRSIVITLGVDRINDKIEFSGEVAKLAPEFGGAKEKTTITHVYKDLSYGATFEEARVDFNVRRPHPTFLGATRVVVLGANYAKEGIEPYLNRINQMYDYRKTLLAVVSREPAAELFKVKIENDISVGFLIEHSLNYLSQKGSALYTDIGEMLSDIALGEVGYLLPYVGIEQGQIKYLGLAVMKDSKLIGVIDTMDTDGLLYVMGKNPRLVEVMPSPRKGEKNLVSFRTIINKRKIKTDYIDNKVIINIDLELDAAMQYQYHIEPITDVNRNQLQSMIEQKVKNDIKNIIKRTQEDYKCDVLEFGKYFRADNYKVYQEIKWSEEYPKAEINVDVKVKIINENMAEYKPKTEKTNGIKIMEE